MFDLFGKIIGEALVKKAEISAASMEKTANTIAKAIVTSVAIYALTCTVWAMGFACVFFIILRP